MLKEFFDQAETQTTIATELAPRMSKSAAHDSIKVFELIFAAHRLALEVECFLVAEKIGNKSDHRMLTTFLHNWAHDLESETTAKLERATFE